MANVTDPLVNQLSGSDPQNLMEYILRQRIYDSRYWKEECFGLTVADVLEKATHIQTLGTFPCRCLALILKLLQLHPEHEIVASTFVRQSSDFKYVRAIGCVYIRMTSRPVEIYETLEPIYADYRKLRVYKTPYWHVTTMDQFIHELLSSSSSGNALGIALPRLPARRVLVEAGYLNEARPTALQQQLADENKCANRNDNNSDKLPPALAYLRYVAEIEHCPAAMIAWEKRRALVCNGNPETATTRTTLQRPSKRPKGDNNGKEHDKKSPASLLPTSDNVHNNNNNDDNNKEHFAWTEKKHKKKKKKEPNYGTLFKKS
jgi:pre-mRNA-splicing factor 38A